jgi:hypothetical protein
LKLVATNILLLEGNMNSIINKALLLLFSTVILISCSDDNSVSNDPTDASKLQNGTWVVTYYWDDEKDETSMFSNHDFTFSSNGDVEVLFTTVMNAQRTYSGSWSYGMDDSVNKLYLTFSTSTYLDELSDDWHVVELSENRIRLQDVSGGNGETDYLTFERK